MTLTISSGDAPAKSILFGEHAVVYGKPAIAIPLSAIRAYAQVRETTDYPYPIHIEAVDIAVSSDLQDLAVDHPIRSAIRFFYTAINRPYPEGISIHLHSDIPIASGLGSGAAVAIALLRALAKYEAIDLSIEQISELAFEIEKIHHGTPSGIDNTVIAYEKPVWYVKNKVCRPFQINNSFHLLIANSGISASTAISVADVREIFTRYPERIQACFDRIEDITHQATHALDTGDSISLGKLMVQNHTALQQLTVSTPFLDAMIQCALDAGALGAKLSGGGRGGNVIVLTQPETEPRIRNSLQELGISQFFYTHLGESTS